MGKLKLKNTVTIQQEKLLAEKEEKLQKEQKELQDVGQSLRSKEQEVENFLCFCVWLFVKDTPFLRCLVQISTCYIREWLWLQLDSIEINNLFLFEKLVMTHIPIVFIS